MKHLCLTPKQLEAVKLALRSAAGLRSTERERAYIRAVLEQIKKQEGL